MQRLELRLPAGVGGRVWLPKRFPPITAPLYVLVAGVEGGRSNHLADWSADFWHFDIIGVG